MDKLYQNLFHSRPDATETARESAWYAITVNFPFYTVEEHADKIKEMFNHYVNQHMGMLVW